MFETFLSFMKRGHTHSLLCIITVIAISLTFFPNLPQTLPMLISYVCGTRGQMTADFLAAIAPVWQVETACSRNAGSFLEKPSGLVYKSALGGSRQPGILLLIRLVFPPLP